MKNLGNMLKQAQQMQARMQEMQARLEASVTDGQAGAGMVKVTLSGKGELKRIVIDPSLMDKDEREVLEALIVAAHPRMRTVQNRHTVHATAHGVRQLRTGVGRQLNTPQHNTTHM